MVLREELENNIRIDNDIYKSRIQPELQSHNLTLAAGHLLKLKELFHPDRHKDVLRMPKSGRVPPNLKKRSFLSTEGFVSAGQSEGAGSETVDNSQTKGRKTQVLYVHN